MNSEIEESQIEQVIITKTEIAQVQTPQIKISMVFIL